MRTPASRRRGFGGGFGLVACAAWVLAAAAGAQTVVWPANFQGQLAAELNASMGKWLDSAGYGYWFGFQNATHSFGIALGASNGVPVGVGGPGPGPRVAASTTDVVPAGSMTKTFTAAMVMALVENGTVGINDPIAPHVDPWLSRVNGTTLEALYGPTINNVTVRMLLSMRSGVADYNDALIFNLTVADPAWDISPLDYLALNPKTFLCPPGTCSGYSSTNFLLLAMACANHANATSWEDLDQKAFFPTALRPAYSDVVFFEHGPCSAYPRVVHYYIGGNTTSNSLDMHNTSCLNGWGFGNIGITAVDAASFYYDLLGPTSRVLSRRSALEMQQFVGIDDPHDAVVGNGHHYGLGLWTDGMLAMSGLININAVPSLYPMLRYVGHAGDDYGTITKSGYHLGLDMGFSIMVNGNVQPNPKALLVCPTWRAIWKVLQLPGWENNTLFTAACAPATAAAARDTATAVPVRR